MYSLQTKPRIAQRCFLGILRALLLRIALPALLLGFLVPKALLEIGMDGFLVLSKPI